jgi:putative transposase
MDREQRERTAVFRFQVIGDLVGNADLSPGEQERLIREKCSRKWHIPFSSKTRLTRSTILRWMKLYKESGCQLDALVNQPRSDRGHSRVIDQETGLALIRLREEFPKVTVARLIKTMQERRLVSPGSSLAPATVWRFLKEHGILKPNAPAPEDRRKFEAELPNDLWQSDCMHGPAVEHGDKRRKTYLLAFIDDHSRLIPNAEFFLSESLDCYLRALEGAISMRGLPRKLYTDNGPAFRSHHLESITAGLGIALVHARPYKPQGKGKIERFFRTVRSDFLPGFKGDTLDDLNLAMHFWLNDIYHQRIHSSTGQCPFERFTAHMECIRQPPRNLQDYFRKTARRKVAKDRTVSLGGRIFEAPVALVGKQVSLMYHDEDPQQVEILLNGRTYGLLAPLDIHVNCRVKRDKNNNPQLISTDQGRSYKGGSLWGRRTHDDR